MQREIIDFVAEVGLYDVVLPLFAMFGLLIWLFILKFINKKQDTGKKIGYIFLIIIGSYFLSIILVASTNIVAAISESYSRILKILIILILIILIYLAKRKKKK